MNTCITPRLEQAPKVRCPQCEAEGTTSLVTEGVSSTTLAYSPRMWDAEGNPLPWKNPNTVTTSYECSRGHRFMRRA